MPSSTLKQQQPEFDTTEARNSAELEFGLTGVLMTTTPPLGPTRNPRGVWN